MHQDCRNWSLFGNLHTKFLKNDNFFEIFEGKSGKIKFALVEKTVVLRKIRETTRMAQK